MTNCRSDIVKKCNLTKQDFDEIKLRVGMREVAEFYGYPVNRQGRCTCPFHDDRRPSMLIYPHNRGYYCFVCNAGGDVVTFVSKLYGLGAQSAARKLIDDFSLPIKVDGLSYREQRERERAVQQRREMQRFVRGASDALNRYRQRLCVAARNPDDPLFMEALQMLAIVEYRLDCLKECPQELRADKKVVRWIGGLKQRFDAAE